jgi:hypothetical protein
MAGIDARLVTAAAKSATNRMPVSWPRVDGLTATREDTDGTVDMMNSLVS